VAPVALQPLPQTLGKGPGDNEALVTESRIVKQNRTRELYKQYVNALKSWQIRLAIGRLRHFRVPPDSWEDTMQELAIVVHEFRFDPAKSHGASEETILCRFFDRRIKMLARCNARRLAMLERLGQMSQQVEDTRLPEDAIVEEEVRSVVAQLPPLRQEICQALADGESVYLIARRTGMHYETIRRHVRHIRAAFTNRGLD